MRPDSLTGTRQLAVLQLTLPRESRRRKRSLSGSKCRRVGCSRIATSSLPYPRSLPSGLRNTRYPHPSAAAAVSSPVYSLFVIHDGNHYRSRQSPCPAGETGTRGDASAAASELVAWYGESLRPLERWNVRRSEAWKVDGRGESSREAAHRRLGETPRGSTTSRCAH
jgi:hypothetical protein